MATRQQIQERRRWIVEQMLGIESMRRGTLNEQFLRVSQKGCKEPALRGPYYVLSRNEHGKTVSERVARADVERIRQDIVRYNQFIELCREFANLTESLGACTMEEEGLKKKPKLPSRRTRK